MKYFVWILLLSSFSANADVGFSQGNQLTAVVSQGEIFVQCTGDSVGGGPRYAHFYCQEDLILTGEYDYFVGPQGVAADEVTLTALHEDGSQRKKTVAYDSKAARSAKRFNLWISTLLQRPLLDPGLNRISYKMTLKGKLTAQGEFEVQVKDGGKKVCSRRGSYWSNNSMDCNSGSHFCGQFFRENNYCL